MFKNRVFISSALALFFVFISITDFSLAQTLPSHLDWRDYQGENGIPPGNYVTPVKHFVIGITCDYFARTAGLESHILIRERMPNVDLDLSEQALYLGCSNLYEGLPLETCFPVDLYLNGGTCSDICSNWRDNTYKVNSMGTVPSSPDQAQFLQNIKTALYLYGPLETFMTSCSGFSDPLFLLNPDAVYHYTSTETCGAGHAVLTIGYDDAGQYFIGKHSWADSNPGFFKIGYSEVFSRVQLRPSGVYDGDNDGDGILNHLDNCPNVYNPLQEDSDNNGIGDSCEASPISLGSSGSGINNRVEYCGWYDGHSKKRTATCYQGNWSVDPCTWTASCSTGWIGVDERGTCTSSCPGPAITSVAQSGFNVGDTVILYGTNLCGGMSDCSSMSIGLVNTEASATSATSTTITFNIPGGAQTGPVQLILNGTVLNSNKPDIIAAPLPPSIISISQSGSNVKDSVYIYGANLCGGSTHCNSLVKIGFLSAPEIETVVSIAGNGFISFQIPDGAQTGQIQIKLNGAVLITSQQVVTVNQTSPCNGWEIRCNDNNVCTTDTCDATTGNCIHTPNTLSCDDYNACTENTRCSGGVCTGGTAKNCNDNNACTIETCDPAIGCVYTPIVCNDNNVCTTDTCDPATGCVFTNNTLGCTDNNPCTENDVCSGGVCVPGTPKVCMGGLVCDPATGCSVTSLGNNFTMLLSNGYVSGGTNDVKFTWDGTLQDAATFANGNGQSNATISSDEPFSNWLWYAKHVQVVGPGTYWVDLDGVGPSTNRFEVTIPSGQIGAHMLFDWGETGQATSCGKTNCDVDIWIAWEFNKTFAAGKLYTGADDGTNSDGPAYDDPYPLPFVIDGRPNADGKVWGLVSVDLAGRITDSNGITITNLPLDGVPGIKLREGSFPTANANFNVKLVDLCADAVTRCNDNNACTTDTCDEGTGACSHTAIVCDDGNPCTIDTCDTVNGCVFAPKNCDDNNACTGPDYCNPLTGACVNTPVANGTSCSDNNLCNGAETCQGGICTAGTPLVCNDNNPCTTDACNPSTGCVYTPVANGTSCADNNICNGTETCQGGICTAGTPLVCNDNNPCTTDTCNPATGCVYTPVANGTSCADSNVCNGAETCQGGICKAGTPLVCNDNNICTTDSCNPATGCVYTPVANGTSCSDGNLCNGAETCQGGICKAGTPLVCNDNNLCTTDTCDPAKGCVYTPKCDDNNVCTTDTCNTSTGACTHTNNTLSCNDNNACTTNDKCSSGVCKGTAKVCNDNNACTTDTCDTSTGACMFTPKVCNDNNPCTTDTCNTSTGACVFTAKNCNDNNACTTDSCNTATGACINTPILCNDNKSCTTDTCNPASGCVYTAVANGTACTEVANGVCQTGTCVNIDLIPMVMTVTKSGTTVTVNDTVKNQGTSNCAVGFTITYYLSINTTYESGTDIVLASSSNGSGTCSRTVNSLNTGSSSAKATTCYKPSGAKSGQSYYVLAVDDSGHQVSEYNENNNVKATGSTISW